MWSQIIIKETADQVEMLTRAPRTGIGRLAADGSVEFLRPERDWHGIDSESEPFCLRIPRCRGITATTGPTWARW